jgi:anhydro-N-acetylmuramic acid kinase
MKSSFPILWGSDRNLQPEHRIDRALYSRTYRMVAGLAYDPSFQQMRGALVVVTGYGKFLRLKHSVYKTIALPDALATQCRMIIQQSDVDWSAFQALLADLASLQAGLVDRLKIEAGKYVDRILAISICDPGLWSRDFDGRLGYSSFSDPVLLAELTGMNVLDAFPARDVLVGGSGGYLESLPLWLLAAERNNTVSQRHRLLITEDPEIRGYFLPASDGIDAEFPKIRIFRYLGQQWESVSGGSSTCVTTEAPLENRTVSEIRNNHDGSALASSRLKSVIGSKEFTDRLQQLLRDLIQGEEVELILAVGDSESLPDSTSNWMQGLVHSTIPLQPLGCSPESLPAVVAALLGFLHIDQLPGNLPWLTGGNGQRILGRLTAGKPSQWRQLIRVMADYQPAAMKLKDAV